MVGFIEGRVGGIILCFNSFGPIRGNRVTLARCLVSGGLYSVI